MENGEIELVQEYTTILKRIQKASDRLPFLSDKVLFSCIVTEAPVSYRHYGMIRDSKNKFIFYFSESNTPFNEDPVLLSPEKLAEQMVYHQIMRYESPNQLEGTFLRQVTIGIEEHERKRTRIDERVRRQLSRVERLLKESPK
jgi:hypothetical protein